MTRDRYPDALDGHGSGSWAMATPSDIIDGEFFSDGDAFDRASGVPGHQRDAFCQAAFQRKRGDGGHEKAPSPEMIQWDRISGG